LANLNNNLDMSKFIDTKTVKKKDTPKNFTTKENSLFLRMIMQQKTEMGKKKSGTGPDLM